MNLHNINIQNLYGAESLVSALYLYLSPKDKECCANEDSNLHNVKTMVRGFRVIKVIINDFHIIGRNTNAFSFAFSLVN